MTNDSEIKTKPFELLPIGKIKVEDKRTYMHILPKYSKALKYLDLFSHALIFLKDNNSAKHSNSIAELIIGKILKLEEHRGIIEIDNDTIDDNSLIFDIKPYFPCEDRVKNAKIPDFIIKQGDWREEKININSTSISTINKVSNIELKENYPIFQIGKIIKIDGECFLKLHNTNKDLIGKLEGFSHVKVIWWFNKFDKSIYRKTTECNPPYENAPRTGVFASRSPLRPNPIAITTARILDVDSDNNCIKISHIDAFDKTPIVDILPYIPAYDRIREYEVPHWLKHWPKWLDDRGDNLEFQNIKIIQSDIDKINKYIPSKPTDILSNKEGLKDIVQVKNNISNEINVIGVRQNNLKNINCKIPKNKITVVTGVSGSGKSSLVFDTIYAESQRRFMDSLSPSEKVGFSQMEKPDFDQITGLPPAIAIEQKTTIRNPRSTVGTMTDTYDYIKLLFTRIGTRHCPECGRAVIALKADEIINILGKLQEDTFFSIRGFGSEEIVDEFVMPKDIDRTNDFNKRLKSKVKKALTVGEGAILVNINKREEFLFQTKEMCYHCNKIFFKLTTSTFSFNNPESMCPVCKGLGVKFEVDEDLIVSSPHLSILDGASKWWGNLRKFNQKPNANWTKGEILALAEEMEVDLEIPWKSLPEEFKKQALYGTGNRKVRFLYKNTKGRKGEIVRPVEGAYNTIKRLFKDNNGKTSNRIVSSFMRKSQCKTCQGERLSKEGRMVTVAEKRFPEIGTMTIRELKSWVDSLPKKLSQNELIISREILREVKGKLKNLIDVGFPYLTLDRASNTLSGGEAQRIRLATQLGSGITNILYVLDEPSIGLHPKDHEKLIEIMERIRDEGNTLIVVEHDPDTMLRSDKIIDIGPGAGIHGGSVIAEGAPEEILLNEYSKTGKYLKNIKNKELENIKKRKKPWGWLKIIGAKHNNLKNIDVSIPLGILTCITGVSGSGKSSLIIKTLYPGLLKFLNNCDETHGDYEKIEGIEGVDKVISISQQPIGRTPRSNPATYTGVFDNIRELFSSLDESKKRKYKKGKFSFNSKTGQCEACKGKGGNYVEMHFMPDIWVECSICHGRRFNGEVLEIKYKDKTIADILDMDIEEALDFFKDNQKIATVLQTLYDVGLGYIKLGQNALTLSGGEAQRIKLAKELSKSDTGKTIYVLDEPTTGLHFEDVENLKKILHRIIEAGNTVLVIEHNLDVIKSADWIIDLGPEGGDDGGYIIAEGTPEQVKECKDSVTGKFLKEFL